MQPLREGGSLPAVVETDDGLYVVKFRGAGQGPRALVAELLVGLLASLLELPVPELALVHLPPPFGRSEPDPEIQDVLRRSHGLNVGLRYLDGAFNFDCSAAADVVTADFAARLVWLDALVTNPGPNPPEPQSPGLAAPPVADRPRRGALRPSRLGERDAGEGAESRSRSSSTTCSWLTATGSRRRTRRSPPRWTTRRSAPSSSEVPDELLSGPEYAGEAGPEELRARYRGYLGTRLRAPRPFLAEAVEARERLRRMPSLPQSARR